MLTFWITEGICASIPIIAIILASWASRRTSRKWDKQEEEDDRLDYELSRYLTHIRANHARGDI